MVSSRRDLLNYMRLKIGLTLKRDQNTYYQKKTPPPRNHLDIGASRLPTLARNEAGDWLMPN